MTVQGEAGQDQNNALKPYIQRAAKLPHQTRNPTGLPCKAWIGHLDLLITLHPHAAAAGAERRSLLHHGYRGIVVSINGFEHIVDCRANAWSILRSHVSLPQPELV